MRAPSAESRDVLLKGPFQSSKSFTSGYARGTPGKKKRAAPGAALEVLLPVCPLHPVPGAF